MAAAENESPVETSARTAAERGDHTGGAKALIEGYGKEMFGFIAARCNGNLAYADDVFAEFCVDVWRGLPGFEWRCSARAWCYRLARNAASRLSRMPQNRPERALPLSAVPELEEMVDRARSSTRPYLLTEVKDEFQRLRERLPVLDQELLILRVDRGLSWEEVAHALHDATGEADAAPMSETALRQRFVAVKRRLKELASEAGLL